MKELFVIPLLPFLVKELKVRHGHMIGIDETLNPEFTGADWDANIHVDVIPTSCTIEVDGRVIMRDGKFTI